MCPKSITVISCVAGDGDSCASVLSMCSFLTVDFAFVLQMLRSSGDLAISVTVLLVGLVDIKSVADDEAAMMRGFVVAGE